MARRCAAAVLKTRLPMQHAPVNFFVTRMGSHLSFDDLKVVAVGGGDENPARWTKGAKGKKGKHALELLGYVGPERLPLGELHEAEVEVVDDARGVLLLLRLSLAGGVGGGEEGSVRWVGGWVAG